MNNLQYYLTKLAEECSEVAQIALKTQQFGPNEVMPGQPLSNLERCHLELDDMRAVVEELNAKFGFDYLPNRERLEAKKRKILKYRNFSMHLGLVENSLTETPAPPGGKPEGAEGSAKTLRREVEQLRAFAKKMLEGWPDSFGGVDGFSIQDAAVECGLLAGEVRREPCGDNCSCADSCGDMSTGVTCYRRTTILTG